MINVEIPIEGSIEIVINDQLQLHIAHSNEVYVVDYYKNPEAMLNATEDHDFDEDFIDSNTIWLDDIADDSYDENYDNDFDLAEQGNADDGNE